jgi:hypothetical protein
MKPARPGDRVPAQDTGSKPFFPLHPSRADSFTESVIREMTRLALQHDAINLAQGFPDFPCPALHSRTLPAMLSTGIITSMR